MNIFVLDEDPQQAAKYHCDKHMKLLLEAAQLLCIAHKQTGSNNAPYKGQGFKNHPCSVWTRESIENYRWLVKLGLFLCKEYTYRYGKIHKSQSVIEWAKNNEPNLPNIPRTPFVQAMPDDVKNENTVEAYRAYYCKYKSSFAKWKKREIPCWYIKNLPLEEIIFPENAEKIVK